MTAVITPAEAPERVVLDDHEFDVDCDANCHEEFGTGPAVYMVWLNFECSCMDPSRQRGLVCEGCLQWTLTTVYGAQCNCGAFKVAPYRLVVDRYERIKS